MRTNQVGRWRSLWNIVAALGAVGLVAANAAAQTTVSPGLDGQIHLIAAPMTKVIATPNGSTVNVPMWGFGADLDNDGAIGIGESVSVPGPRIVLPAGTTSMTVTLKNLLPEAASVMVPGQPTGGTPERNLDGRVRSMVPEAAGNGGMQTYSFSGLKPGTFLYESGSHPAVQVQMGLYGAMTVDESAGNAYAGVPYAHERVLLFSEIDPALHASVDDGSYGTTGRTSTVDYRPAFFLINGESYTNESMATLPSGTATELTLLRMLNAGLITHAPMLVNGSLRIIAEDGNKLPYERDQATVLLSAGKTHDALWTPANAGVYSLYDRRLGLNVPGQGNAGMLAKLDVAALVASSDPVTATNHSYGTTENVPLGVSAAGVLVGASGSGTLTAQLVSSTHAGSLTLNGDGSFSYSPSPSFFGVDSFAYTATNGTNTSAAAMVTIMVTGVPDAPVALAQSVGVDQNGNTSVTLTATDADGDPLTYYLSSLPSHGTVGYIDALTKVEVPIGGADLRGGLTPKAIPGGVVVYTPAASYAGADGFMFVASDGSSDSAAAQVGATVYADEGAAASLGDPVMLTVLAPDGSTIGAYRWTLEEDLMYKVIPGVADPNTQAVSFHKSYMPVVASGTEADPIMVDSTKRYFVSVLPTEGTFSNSGAEIEVGQTSARVVVAALPLPTARIRVRVFQDNAPLNGMWDSTELGLAGFQVTIDDAGGTYGQAGGHQSTDAFGNKIGTKYQACSAPPCDSYEVSSLGDGFVLSDSEGYAVIENLVMGKYTVKVRAPGGDQWIQTTTIEGQPGIDAWVKPNEPQFFTEFGPPGPHVFVGFTRAEMGTGLLGQGPGPFTTITGRVTNLRMSRVPAVAQFSGAPFDTTWHTHPWVALNSGATGGSLLYTQPTNADGTFSIANVPPGSYQLVVFDSALDIIIGTAVVTVNAPAPSVTDVHDVAVFSWFTNLYSFVFDDTNRDGIHQAGEPGIADTGLNIRFRDGSIYKSLSTDERGFKAFNEVFPFFAWMVAEVDYARYHSTGLTVVVDDGGDSGPTGSNAYNWQAQAGLPSGLIPPEVLNPQPQPDNFNEPFRTESGAETPFLLLEGFQGFIGQSTVMMWGKAPYEPVGSYVEDINVAPFDDFPGVGDVDSNGDGFFNTDRANGGIAGIVHYSITRAENDPRWGTAEDWEPGVSDVTIQLWDENRTHLLYQAATDNWNNSVPEGCQWPGNVQFQYLGRSTDCFDGLRIFNQARPALFDGGYAFSSILVDAFDPEHPDQWTANLPYAAREASGVLRPIPAGKYVVKMIVPPGYKLQKEEDKNVDFGDSYVPQQFWLDGYPLADGGLTDAQPAPEVADAALVAPFCVGQLHQVPETLSLFPGQVAGAFAGEMRPLCDAKLVNLRPGQQAAPDFYLFTDAPVAGHVTGMVLDDTTNEFDPNAPTFGEKYAVPFASVSIRDWQGREVTHTYSDQYGMYNALVPSSYTANPPEPSGVSPQLLSACINSPTIALPNGTVVADPNFLKQYSHFCYPLQYLAGKTTYLDTPLLPTGAFTGNGTFPVDAEFPNGTPVVARVTGPEASFPGPYIVDRADAASRTITITSAAHPDFTSDGLTEVANPAFDGGNCSVGSCVSPKLIKRDYGFGSTQGSVTVGGTTLAINSWTNTSIEAVVPAGVRTGELQVLRNWTSHRILTTPLSSLVFDINAAAPTLQVQVGDGKKFAVGGQIRVDNEVMQVTGGNRSVLADNMGTGTGVGGTTLRVVNGAGVLFTTPANVSVEDEIITLDGKTHTVVRTNQNATSTTLNVTAGTGNRFLIGDIITVGTEMMLVNNSAGNNLTVTRGYNGTIAVTHAVNDPVVANDRFEVTRATNGTVIHGHPVGAAVVGDILAVTRGLASTTADAHLTGAIVNAYSDTATTDTRASTLAVTLSVATPQMHEARPPVKVWPGEGHPIQDAIDAASSGDLILVQPGIYEEMVVMSKPVRLQGAGALSTVINVVTTPAENVQAWLDKVGNLLLNVPAYSLPTQPAMTPAPFQSGDVAAVVGDEGPGVMVLSKSDPITGTGQCLSTTDTSDNFANPANEAYCLHNENWPSTSVSAAWRPNARVDGLTLIGSSNAPGVLVNGHAHYLELSNNKINTNSGTYAGGVQIGHVAVPFAEEPGQNDHVAVHHNHIAQNAGNEIGGGGGVVLGAGSDGYSVAHNFIAANYTGGNGGGVSHIGLSTGGSIDANTVVFNESFFQSTGTNGGGIFIGGAPAAVGALTPGSGSVDVTNNLIQGNAASGGDGGGLALLNVNGQDLSGPQARRHRVRVLNNVIANNVAALAGGGISIEGTQYVDITHDTIVHNDSTATAGAAFGSPLVSAAQPAGIVFRGDVTTNVQLANSIIWQNRTYTFGPVPTVFCGNTVPPNTPPCSIVPVGSDTGATQYGEIQNPMVPFWDLGVLGGTGALPLESSILTALSGQPGGVDYSGFSGVRRNLTTPPAFRASYFNTDRRNAYQVGETTGEATLISVPAALDEGGNFIRPQFGPLSLETLGSAAFFGNYHVSEGVQGQSLWRAEEINGGVLYGTSYANVPPALWTDFDQQIRPNANPDRGADQVVLPIATTPVPQRQ